MGRPIEVTVYFDRQLDLKAVKTLQHGSTVADLKAALAEEDPTGQASADDFVLAPLPAREGTAAQPLQDGMFVTEALAELVVCDRDAVESASEAPVEAPADGGAEQCRLRAEYEAQIEQLKALGVTNLPPPPPDLDEADTSAAEGGEDMMQRLAMQRILDEQNLCSDEENAEQAAPERPRWEVVGGADRGGILVREGQDLASAQLPLRLSTGAQVEELELLGERLHFRRAGGEGPDSGWVSIRLKGKDLLLRVDGECPTAAAGASAGVGTGAGRCWADLDGQAVGPWPAHGDKVTTVLFDRFNGPPKESRVLYTACWMEAKVCAWGLSRAGGRGAPPRRLGGLSTGGLVSGVAVASSSCLLAAVSANPPPETSSVCHQADFKQRLAEQDDQLGPGDTLLAWDLGCQPFQVPAAEADAKPQVAPQKIPLHRRGCHAVSVWPALADGCCQDGGQPRLVASVSSDCLAVSRARAGAPGLESPGWTASHPHGPQGEPRHLCWESAESLWTSDRSGTLKLWDISRGEAKAKCEVPLSLHSFAHIAIQPAAGLMMAATEDGIAFFDTRACRLIRTQFTKDPVKVLSVLPGEHATVFAGVGRSLVQYETRTLAGGGLEPKSRALGVWSLPSKVLALDCIRSAGGKLLVAVGCQDGNVAAFDTS